jgi:hypothetical protein
MNEKMKLTYKDLQTRWTCSRSTVVLNVRKFGLTPCDFRGLQPLFDEKDVIQMEQRRFAERAEQIGLSVDTGRILTVAQAKRRAGKAVAK